MADQKQRQEVVNKQLAHERYQLLHRVENALEGPMVVLGFIWLLLLVLELIRGLSPLLQLCSNIIWVIFILDFILKFILAPHKLLFLRKNVLTTISLVVPALRVFRVTRLFRVMRSVRAVRGLRLVKVISSINRGMRSLGKSMQRRAFGYVMGITLVVVLAGSAGMYAFENKEGLTTYGDALWWTVMLLTSIGSDYFPVTAEGRMLCLLLALYGFAVFGYFTATLATFFIDRDADSSESEVAGARQVRALEQEIKMLRSDLQAILQLMPPVNQPPKNEPPPKV